MMFRKFIFCLASAGLFFGLLSDAAAQSFPGFAKPGHVIGNSTAGEKKPEDSALSDIIGRAGGASSLGANVIPYGLGGAGASLGLLNPSANGVPYWNGSSVLSTGPLPTANGGLYGATLNAIPFGQGASENPSFVSPANNAVMATNGSGIPSEVTTLPSALTIPGGVPSGNWGSAGGTLSVVNLYSSPPANGFYFSGTGAPFSIGPSLGHAPGDTQRTGFYDIATTQIGASAQELTAFISMEATKGYDPAWTISTSYVAGNEVNANGNIYVETVASCTSASSGGGPSGTGSGIVDNTCRWNFEVPTSYNTNGKTALGVTTNAYSGAGATWGIAVNCQRSSGYATTNFSACLEDDFNVEDGDHAPGGASGAAYQMILSGFSSSGDMATAALAVSTTNSGSNYQNHYGFAIINSLAAKDVGFINGASSTVSFQDNNPGGSIGFEAAGTYSTDAFDTTAATISGNQVAFNAKAGQRICLNVGDVCFGNFASGLELIMGGNDAFFIGSDFSINAQGVFIPKSYTVSTLPAGKPKGSVAFVTDATGCTFGGSLTGGGSTYCPVVYNGSSWIGG